MILCPACRNIHPSDLPACGRCGFAPQQIDGFPAWAPELAHSGGGFKPQYFEALFEVEASSFWFRARNRLVIWALKKWFPGFRSLLEVGCGTGFVLGGIADAFPRARLTGTEIFADGLRFAAARTPTASFMQMDARAIPFVDEFEMIGAFDVLEHIEEDETALANLYRALKPGGGLLISVPQHMALWSEADETACHARRYSRGEMQTKVATAGFEILRSTSFVSLLLPAMALSRMQRRRDADPLAELRLGSRLNQAMERVMDAEAKLIRMGIDLPVGGSRLVIARKPVDAAPLVDLAPPADDDGA